MSASTNNAETQSKSGPPYYQYFIVVLVLATLVVVDLLCASLKTRWQSRTDPEIGVINGTAFNAGRVLKGHLVQHTFKLTNRHMYPVEIRPSTTGCECTTALMSSTRISAHGEAEVTIRVVPDAAGSLTAGACVVSSYANKSSSLWVLVNADVVDRKVN